MKIVRELLMGIAMIGAATTQAGITASDAAAWRQDLHYFATELPKKHKNAFHAISPADFETAVAALDARIPSLDRNSIIVEFARLVTLIGDGHTGIADFFTTDRIGFGYYPVALYLFDDGLYVYAAAPQYASLIGGRVLRVNDVPIDEAFDRLRPLVWRDNESGFKDRIPAYLATPEVLHAVGLANDQLRAGFTVIKDSRTFTVALEPLHAGRPRLLGRSLIVPPGWLSASSGEQPLWLRNAGDFHWLEGLPESQTLYVQYNEVANKPEESVRDFAQRLTAAAAKPNVARMVLDLRWNTGGNNYLNRPVLLAIIKSPVNVRGRMFTLIGRKTFSAAQNLVNDLEKYTDTIFIGEPTAEHPNFYADAARIVLPNSGITILASALWWQDLDSRDKRTATGPQIATDFLWQDYTHGRDPALLAALGWQPAPTLADQIEDALRAGNFGRAREIADAFKADRKNRYLSAESSLNSLGYRLLQGGNTVQAIEVFRINVMLSPDSGNVYDSLGEAYAQAGQKELALEAYRQAAALDPSNSNAADMVRQLGRSTVEQMRTRPETHR